jgi:hypothetical protein
MRRQDGPTALSKRGLRRLTKRSIVGLVIGCSAASQSAHAQPAGPTGPQCSAAYYQALEPVRTGRGVALSGLHRALRSPDAELPGRWQFAHQLFSKAKSPPPKLERVCVDQRDINGKARCFKFETKPATPPPTEITFKLPHTPEELRLLRTIHDVVEAKGALPDVGNNGKFNFLVQRVAQDLRLYALQAEHPAMCAGSAEVLEFYGAQLAPLKRRIDEVALISKQLKELASNRVRQVALAEMKVYDKTIAEASKVAFDAARVMAEAAAKSAATVLPPKLDPNGTTAPPSTAPAAAAITLPNLAAPKPLPAKPDTAAKLEDFAVVSITALISEALRPVLPAAVVTEIGLQTTPLATLQKARLALIDPATTIDQVPLDVREAAFMALRLIEARVYAERYVTRYADLDAAMFGALADVRAAQAKACICRE